MNCGIFGNSRERIPRVGFRMMSLLFTIRDRLTSPWSVLDQFGIERGQTVVDYGCGPGSYLKRASELVGPEGRVLAVDIHELAIKAVMKRIDKERLTNVKAVRTDATGSSLPDETADVIYALDMFHMVRQPAVFLRELNRICKATGVLCIDSGHQSRKEASSKIRSSGAWAIVEEKQRYLKCTPTKESKERPKKDLPCLQGELPRNTVLSTEGLTGTSFR
jgi:ubiquinone/menaquinone biosynthesis C-methylase UbiE